MASDTKIEMKSPLKGELTKGHGKRKEGIVQFLSEGKWTDINFQSISSSETQWVRFKALWKQYVMDDNAFYGYDTFTNSFLERFSVTWWWYRFIQSHESELGIVLQVLEAHRICLNCGLLKFLEGFRIPKGGPNPITMSLVEVTVIILQNREKYEKADDDIFLSIFYATDSHALGLCPCQAKQAPKTTEVEKAAEEEPTKEDKDKDKGKGKEKDRRSYKLKPKTPKKKKKSKGEDDAWDSLSESDDYSSDDGEPMEYLIVKTSSPENLTHHLLREQAANIKKKLNMVMYTFDVSLKHGLDYGEALSNLVHTKSMPVGMQMLIYPDGWAARKGPGEPWKNHEGILRELKKDTKCTIVFSSMKLCLKNTPQKSQPFLEPKDILTGKQIEQIVNIWLEEADTWKENLRRRAIEKAFELAVRRLKKLIVWDADEKTPIPNLTLSFGIKRFHQQIFEAAGDMKTIRQYGKTYDDKIALSMVTDLILREAIVILSEQIQNAPSRINVLFHHYRNAMKKNNIELQPSDLQWIQDLDDDDSEPLLNTDVSGTYVDIFRRRIQFKLRYDHIPLNKYLHETLDLDKIKSGIKEFKDDQLNFDDIEDSGRWGEEEARKTFKEPFSVLVLPVMVAKYVPDIIIFKLWMLYALYAIKSNFDLPANVLSMFVIVDMALLLVFWIIGWIIRISMTCICSPLQCNSFKYLKPITNSFVGYSLIIRVILDAIAALGAAGGIIGFSMLNPDTTLDIFAKIQVTAASLGLYYFLARMAIGIITHFVLPTPPTQITRTVGTKKRSGISARLRCCSNRALFRGIFMLLFIALTGVYEYYLVIDGIDSFSGNVYCGNRAYQLGEASFDTQYFLCTMTQILIWLVIVTGVMIDTGLGFTFLMSVFGFVRGAATQGEARANVKLSRPELEQKIRSRYANTNVNFLTAPDKIWKWAVGYWREQDLISNEERDMLRTSSVIDINELSSPQARENIGFWINSLTVKPIKSPSFREIPKTSILIPVYSEKLEFPWLDEPNVPYYPLYEAKYLMAKFPHHWLNLQQRIDELGEDVNKKAEITEWLSMHDQLVYRTVKGAASYYEALLMLADLEDIPAREAAELALDKIEIILCVQIYQRRYKEVKPILIRWMQRWPFLKIAFDFTRTKNMPAEFCDPANIPLIYDDASCLVTLDEEGKIRYSVNPRENVLLISSSAGRVQGKAMNQSNGLLFATGSFIQVLDANQGGHATEYSKFPALLAFFKLNNNPYDASISKRIIGSREYVFTGPLSTVASFHAYQEWSFGTLVLRVYSDLGIRLHYGHPDVFHGAWAWAHSGLSKVNPDINTSEDVFAGMEAMLCKERATHVEHIQFEKGRETGLPSMSGFDTKISAGNAGLLRSRDIYHLMERLSFLKRFMFFYGISGHFVTISLMVLSLQWYIWTLVMFSMSGVSLEAMGGTIFSTEWILHAGFTTVIPLIAELLVERGVLIGLFDALLFVPISTVVYLFQMQTKHNAFAEGIVTGKSAHINTGRGLAIYRQSLRILYTNYVYTHYFPIFNVLATTAVYWAIVGELGGGSLPLIMIYLFCCCVLAAPQLFNPTLMGNTFYELVDETVNFVSWVGKSSTQVTLDDWKVLLKQTNDEDDFLRYWLKRDTQHLPTKARDAAGLLFYRSLYICFWLFVIVFLLYPGMQFWFGNYFFYWMIFVICYWSFMVPFKLLRLYLNPLSIVLWLVMLILFFSFLFTEGAYRRVSSANIYISGFVTVKLLQSFRAFLLTLVSFVAHLKFHKQKESYNAYVYANTLIINKLFMVNALRTSLAIVWLALAFGVALVMRPLWANLFLFGRYTGQEKSISVKVGAKTVDIDSFNFKVIQDLPDNGPFPLPPKPGKGNFTLSVSHYEYPFGPSGKVERPGKGRGSIWTTQGYDPKLATAIEPDQIKPKIKSSGYTSGHTSQGTSRKFISMFTASKPKVDASPLLDSDTTTGVTDPQDARYFKSYTPPKHQKEGSMISLHDTSSELTSESPDEKDPMIQKNDDKEEDD